MSKFRNPRAYAYPLQGLLSAFLELEVRCFDLPRAPSGPSFISLDRSPENQRLAMFRFIAFLRAINVGGGRTVKMQSLRQVFESLGFSKVATFIASGNVVFETTTKEAKTLERKIERALKEALSYEVRTFVREEAELIKIVAYRPPFSSRSGGVDVGLHCS